jgi:hypothetical protein
VNDQVSYRGSSWRIRYGQSWQNSLDLRSTSTQPRCDCIRLEPITVTPDLSRRPLEVGTC